MGVKNIIGFICLAAAGGAVGPVAAQTFSTASEIITPVLVSKKAPSTYAVAYGKVIAKKTKQGWTTFDYSGGKLAAERRPDGTVGTYIYDRAGKFQSLNLSDGRIIRAVYDDKGFIRALADNASRRVGFKGNVGVEEKGKSKYAPFLTIQEGVTAIEETNDIGDPVCEERSPIPCVVDAPGGGGGGGGGGDGGGGVHDRPGSGGGGGGGTGGPTNPTPPQTPEECKAKICDGAKPTHEAVCEAITNNPTNRRLCFDKVFEYYSKCLRSCDNGDWSWLDEFNWIFR